MRWWWVVSWCGCFARLAAATDEHAAWLVWRAPSECPTARDVEARVDQLVGRSSTLHPKVAVEVERRPSGYELRIAAASTGAERRLAGDTCSSLAEAAAVILAVLTREEIEAAAAVPSASAAAPVTTPSAKPSEPVTAPWVTGNVRAPAQASPVPTSVPTLSLRPSSMSVRVSGVADFGTLPGVGVGAGLRWRWLRGSWGVGAGFDWLGTQAIPLAAEPNVGGEFALLAPDVEGCRAWRLSERVSWLGCLALEVGAIRAVGTGIDSPRTSLTPWVASSVSMEVDWHVTSWLSLAVRAAPWVAWWRPSFELDEIGFVFRSEAVGLRTSAGLGVWW